MGQKLTKSAKFLFKDVAIVGEKTVRAVVTAPTVDRDYDVINTESLRLPLKAGGWIYAKDLTGNEELDIPFLINHSFAVEDVIGSARSAVINDAGELEVTFGVSSLPKAQDMFTLLDEGHLGNAFSITISDYEIGTDFELRNGEVIEISLVFKGSNRNARLLAVSKSLLKEKQMAEAKKQETTLAEKYAALEALTKDIEEAEKTETVESTETTEVEATEKETEEVETTEETKTEAVAEEEVEEEVEATEVVEKEETTKEETEEDMTEVESKALASKAAGQKASEVETARVEKKVDKNEHKILVVKQIAAYNQKNWEKVRELNERAQKIDEHYGVASKAIKSKALTYEEGNPLYLCEQLWRDVETCYGDYGNLGSLANRISLTESPNLRLIVEDGETRLAPVGFDGTKEECDTDFSSLTINPKPFACIRVWNDHVLEDAAVALYDLFVRNFAQAEAALEDELLTTFATVTVAGTVYPDQGILTKVAPSQVYTYEAGNGNSLFNQILAAVGGLRSCDRGNVTFAMNSSKLFELAGLRNTNGDLIFQGTGGMLNLGIAGNYSVVTSDEIPTSDIIVGDWSKYYLVTKGGLQLTTSNQAMVGNINLFTGDSSALRAVVRMEAGISDASAAGAFAVVRSDATS
jgi:HK97 family phage major capsid protein